MQQKFQAPPKRVPWFKKDVGGTLEEREEAFEVASEYLYKIINYADTPEPIPEGELEKDRRIFAFCMQGPKGSHYRFDKREKLTSADVLYFLSSSLPARELSRRFGVHIETVLEIRRGENPKWYWEYMFVRRLKAILKGEMNRSAIRFLNIAYSISKVTPTSKEILFYTTSLRKAKRLREDIINKPDYKKMVKEDTLDTFYPIEKIEILK